MTNSDRIFLATVGLLACFWLMVGAGALAFLAYEQYEFEHQTPIIAGTIIPPDVTVTPHGRPQSDTL